MTTSSPANPTAAMMTIAYSAVAAPVSSRSLAVIRCHIERIAYLLSLR
jgi:hypothetical protein